MRAVNTSLSGRNIWEIHWKHSSILLWQSTFPEQYLSGTGTFFWILVVYVYVNVSARSVLEYLDPFHFDYQSDYGTEAALVGQEDYLHLDLDRRNISPHDHVNPTILLYHLEYLTDSLGINVPAGFSFSICFCPEPGFGGSDQVG